MVSVRSDDHSITVHESRYTQVRGGHDPEDHGMTLQVSEIADDLQLDRRIGFMVDDGCGESIEFRVPDSLAVRVAEWILSLQRPEPTPRPSDV